MTNAMLNKNSRVAVIGAGISGLIAARALVDHGLPVTVLDKGRGVGGRMSTRRVDGHGAFDHGAQYFTARDPRFQKYVETWMQQGVVASWPDQDRKQNIVVFNNGSRTQQPDTQQRLVGVPAMNSVCKHLAKDLKVQTSTRIETVERVDDGIRLTDVEGNLVGEFDRLIVTAPAAQAAELLAQFPRLANPISQIEMQPCWAVMASFAKPISNDSRYLMPPHARCDECELTPTAKSDFSTSPTFTPLPARAAADTAPFMPPPTIRTSNSSSANWRRLSFRFASGIGT